LGAGNLFDYAESSSLSFMGYSGIEAGYMIAFSFCAVAYLASWLAMKTFVPKYMPIKL
jgi:ACS family hexuronate transporter-like MFS transporter